MCRYRLTAQAESDIVGVLGWSQERFGVEARKRYEALLAAAFRDVASQPGGSDPGAS